MKNNVPLQYTDASNREHFRQYVELRRRVYLEQYPVLDPGFGFEDEIDEVSDTILAVTNGIVAGGARLTISRPTAPRPLPLEEADFRLLNSPLADRFDLRRQPYGEISRMAADPGLAHGFEISSGVGDSLCGLAARKGLDVVFSICPEAPARINGINARRRGVDFHRPMKLDTVFGIEMWLCVYNGLQKVYRNMEREAA